MKKIKDMKMKLLFILLVIAFLPQAKAQEVESRSKAMNEIPMFNGCEALRKKYEKNPSKLERKSISNCCLVEMVKFIDANLEYPVVEKRRKMEGDVWVKFEINEEGVLYNINIWEGVSPGLDKEALRIVNLMPAFIPAKNENGEPAWSSMKIPIKFRL